MKSKISKKSKIITCSIVFVAIIFSVIFAVSATDSPSKVYYKVVHTDVDTYREDLDNLTAPKYTEFPEYFESGEWLFAGWFTDEDCTKALAKTTKTDKAYAKFVPADILGVKAQVNYELYDSVTTNDETGAIRFVTSVDSLDYAEVGFIFDRGRGYEETKSSTSVYRTLYAKVGETDVDGEKTNKFVPSDLFDDSSEFFKTWTYTTVPSSAYITEIKVTPFWITLDGTTVKADQSMRTVNQGRSWEYVYVDDNGNDDTGVGTSGKPYATLNKALSEMKANYKEPYIESYSLDTTGNTEGKDGIVCIKDSLTGASGFSWDDHDMDVIITSNVADISKLDISDISTVVDASTLDLSAVQTVKVGDGVTFANMTLKLFGSTSQNGAVYATGNRFKIAGSVTSENSYTVVYGGGSGTNVPGTDVTILSGTYRLIYGGGRNSNVTGDTHVTLENTNVFDTTAGGEARVHGGCNKGTVEGDTYVTIGKGFNSSTEFNYATHSKYATVWGGGYGDNADTMSIVKGNTYVTVEDDAKANFISGGGFLYSEVQKTSHVIFEGGYAMSIYGGSAGSSKQENLDNDANGKSANTSVVMRGGEVQQVFGGNELGNMEGNTSVQILGGKVTRRVYGGCYNNTNTLGTEFTTSYSVKGNTNVVIGPKADLALNVDADNALCAISRYNTTFKDEVGTLIFNRASYNEHGSKVRGYYLNYVLGEINQQPYHYLVDASGDGDVTVNGNVLHIKPDAKNQAIVKLDNQEVHYATGESDYALPGITSATEKHTVTVEFAAIDENKDVSNYEAYIKDGGYYSTLEETVAMANASTDETVVVLLADAEIDSTLTISDTANMTVQSETGATYTVTYANTENNLFEVSGKLAVKNLNLESAKSGIYMKDGSEVTATNVNVKRLAENADVALVVINKGATFTLNEVNGAASIDGANLVGRGVDVQGTFTMNGGTIQGNVVEGDGAGVNVPEGGSFTLNGGTIQENNASACGGGVAVRGTFIMTDGTIQANDANKGAGVILRATAKADIKGGTIQKNTATEHGGGVYIQSTNANTKINGVTIVENTATDGGGVYVNANSEVTIDTATIQNNTATANGGGIYILKTSNLVLKSGTIASNTAVDGGGVYVSSGQTLTMEDGTIQNNTAALKDDYSHGGGVYVAGTFTMSKGNIQNNTATSDKSYTFGAGVYVTGEFVMNGGSISHHGTKDARSKSKGAGVCVHEGGTFTMNDGSIVYNYASQAGAGVAVEAGEAGNSSFIMYGGTIANNNSSGAAGAIVVRANTAFTMEGGNINNNTASTTGGAVHVLGTVIMKDGDISSNNAANGGGVYTNTNGSFTMEGGNITANTATECGSGVYVGSNSDYPFTMTGGTISNHGSVEQRQASVGAGVYVKAGSHFKLSNNGAIKENYSSENGAGVAVAGKLSYSGGVIEKNNSEKDGGGVYVLESGEFIMNTNNSTGIANNQAANGGGVYVNSGMFTMKQGTINNNTATAGAGVYVNGGTFTMTSEDKVDKTITSNTATTSGAGVYVNAGTFDMGRGTISNHGTSENRCAVEGAGVYVASDAIFNMSGDNTYIKENHTTAMGAGVAVYGTFNMNGGNITDNSSVNTTASQGEGAGVFVNGTGVVAMTAGSISNNVVSGSGAGVSIDDAATFTMSGEAIISGNIAEGSGGGIIVRSTKTETTEEGEKKVATFVMNEGTISNNQAKVSGSNGGGAIFQARDTSILIKDGTISGNKATQYRGGAIYMATNTELTIEDAEITGNQAKNNAGAISGAGNNKLSLKGAGTISENRSDGAVKGILLAGCGKTSQVVMSTEFNMGTNDIRFNDLTTRNSNDAPMLQIIGNSLKHYDSSNKLNIGFHSNKTNGVGVIAVIVCDDAAAAEAIIPVINQNYKDQTWSVLVQDGNTITSERTK